MTMFPTSCPKPKPKARLIARDRAERRVPTGAPRLVESSSDRAERASAEAWQLLLDAVRRSSTARLTLLSGRPASDQVACPWERITSCDASCRCSGTGAVTVDFLRRHYATLADEIEKVTRPAQRQPQ